MSEVKTPESSVVRLQGVGRHRTWVVVFMCALLIPTAVNELARLVDLYQVLLSNRRAFFTTWGLFVAGVWGSIYYLKTWLNSVREVALVGDALRVSTRLRKFTIPLTDVEECKIFIARVESGIEITLGIIPLGSKDFLKVYGTSKIDAVRDLRLFPALQRHGIRLIGVEEFKSDFERLTGKSIEGLFLP